MFRNSITRAIIVGKSSILHAAPRTVAVAGCRHMSKAVESDEQLTARYVQYFESKDIDHWWLSKHINDLAGTDAVPEPDIIKACLKACRRLNDIAMAVRFMEIVHFKCGSKVKEIFPYILQEVGPTLEELGVPTPAQLGMDKPQLALEDVYDM
ncbi:cytochrome c oxidase subunit 5A, mitochondrial-like [Pollicipes pollicipes]|uniref:cytochrome c oxidase subunit 5A, mitochondrial-like n=1 Tax=Pollicipes pollicipes TaxID=41117 RepID=UPI00188558A5|nr:cytochrome c oxidase subunit 5A, mitochondrial-like [Pollicipes pollicipes]XP_037080806.1 cytochrome c oxidase subunit 5A, mitochondrial-like [Pollicipes pollicipes]